MAVMSRDDGVQPYPKLSGAKLQKKPGEELSMNKCSICGMPDEDNPAHSSNYTGVGKHTFKAATKSADTIALVDDTPITFGNELKSLGDGKLGGWAIIFSDENSPDITNDFFTKATDFFMDGDTKAVRPVLYDHGLDPTLKARKLGRGKLEIKDAGVWFETELALADDYDRYIEQMAKKGKLGISTGSASHLIQRETTGKSAFIKSWPIVEVSLTPKPIEPRTKSVMSLKSYADDHDEESVFKAIGMHKFTPSDSDEKICSECDMTLNGGKHAKKSLAFIDDACNVRSMKSTFEEELAEQVPSVYKLDSARDNVLNDIVQAAKLTDITGVSFDLRSKITDLATEYISRWITYATQQAQSYIDGDLDDPYSGPASNGQSRFYLRSFQPGSLQSFLDEGIKSSLASGVTLDEHSAAVVSAISEYAQMGDAINAGMKAFADRVRKKIEFRANDSTKAGRTISAATLKKLQEIYDKHSKATSSNTELRDTLQELMSLAQPEQKGVSYDEILQLQAMLSFQTQQCDMAGVPLTNSNS